jgi:hypothetical protein
MRTHGRLVHTSKERHFGQLAKRLTDIDYVPTQAENKLKATKKMAIKAVLLLASRVRGDVQALRESRFFLAGYAGHGT